MTQTSLVKGVVVKFGVDLNQFDFWIRPRTLPQNVRLNEVQVTTSDQEPAGKETQILSFIMPL